VSAQLTGDTNGCGTLPELGLRWEFSDNLSLLEDLSAGARFRATGPGAATITAFAGTGTSLSDQLALDILRNTGDLRVSAAAPDGGPVDYRITGNGFDQSYTGSTLIEDLSEGVYDWQAVEVLRGPQGALYGPGSTGGSISITRNTVTDLTIDYSLKNVLANFTFNLPDGVTGPFAELSGPNGFSYTFNQRQGTYGFDPGNYSIAVSDADPQGYQFKPKTPAETFSLSLSAEYSRTFDYTAERGLLTVGTTGAPAGIEDHATLTDPQGGPWTVMLPYSGFLAPGAWQLDNKRAVYQDNDNDEIQYFTPRVSGFQFTIEPGIETKLQYEYDKTATRTDWTSQFTVKEDMYGHGPHVNFPSTMTLKLVYDEVNAGGLTVKGDIPLAKLSGTLATNGDITAQGTGDAAGFTDVPFLLTGNVNWSAGTLSGELRIGQETAPTGLPNGPITYSIVGIRLSF